MAVSLNNVKTIFFDLGDTLGEVTRSVLEIWLDAAGENGVALKPDALLESLKAADQNYNPKVYEYKGRAREVRR